MAEGSGGNSTPIWVALITVVGGLLTALIVNVDKWMPKGGSAAAAVAQPSPASPTPVATPSGAQPVASPTAAPTPTPTPSPASTGPIDIGGEWRDDEGSHFQIKQTGTQYEFDQTAVNGTFQMAARGGKISGRDLEHTVEMMTGETGSCNGHLNAAGNKITGSCIFTGDMQGGWTYTMER